MSESSTESAAADPTTQVTDGDSNQPDGAEGADHWKSQARDWEKKANADARSRKQAEAELKKLREQGMSESEKAIEKARAEALAEGRNAALSEVGKELVAAELRAVLKGRHDKPETVIARLDMSSFLKDGRPDRDAIQAWADEAHPERPGGPPDLGLGRREQAPTSDMNSVIRRAAGVTG